MEKIPNKKDYTKNSELESFLKQYPLPKGYEDKIKKAIELKAILNELTEKDHDFIYHNKMTEFARTLQKKYKDYGQYFLYHMLIGSSSNKTTKFDFEGNDSIQKFLEIQNLT